MPIEPSLKLSGWPILERGLTMDLWGNLFVIALSAESTPRELDIYLTQLAKSIDARGAGRFGFLMAGGDAKRNEKDFLHRQGSILKARHQILANTTAGFAMITGSRVARVATRVVFTLAPPPFPYKIADSATDGFAFMEKQGIAFEPGDVEAFRELGPRIGLTIP